MEAFRVGDWRVRPDLNCIERGDEQRHLEPRAMDLLVYFASHAGDVIPKERLIQAVWPDTFVTDGALTYSIAQLRQLLDDNAKQPRYLATIPRRGYRLVAGVAFENQIDAESTSEHEQTAPSGLQDRTEETAKRQKPAGKPWIVASLIVGLILGPSAALILWPRYPPSPSLPRITRYTQLTRSQVIFAPYPSPFPLVTDGSRIYFNEFISGHLGLRQMATTGGEVFPFETPFPADARPLLWDITPDRSHLLLGVEQGAVLEGAPWLLPVVGGPPRRLGEVVGHQSTWSPDASQILYINGSDLYLAGSDGTEPRKLLSAPSRAYWPRFSPDGSRIRFTTPDPKRDGGYELWEASADGKGLRPLLPGWNDPPNQCCGSWTPDGEHYIFQATRENRSQIWAIPERDGLFRGRSSEPVQLTRGPMDFIRPLIGPEGKKIFAIGWHLRGELTRYDGESAQFVPHLPSLSAEWLAFSQNGERIVYTTYPEADLWRARADGSDRLQLTFPPMRAFDPAWSPDGKTIAFVGKLPGREAQIYLISADEGIPRPLTLEDRFEGTPSWSPDGKFLAFSVPEGIRTLHIQSGKASELSGSEDLHDPEWSPNGRYLAAHSADQRKLLLFDFAAGRWEVLAEIDVDRPFWSADGEYVYLQSPWYMHANRSVHRVRLRDRKVEKVVSLRDVRWAFGVVGHWVGLTPDGSLLLLRDLSIHHIYALDWEP